MIEGRSDTLDEGGVVISVPHPHEQGASVNLRHTGCPTELITPIRLTKIACRAEVQAIFGRTARHRVSTAETTFAPARAKLRIE